MLFRASDSEIEDMIVQCSADLAAERLQKQQQRAAAGLSQRTLSDPSMMASSPAKGGNGSEDPFHMINSPDSWRYIQSQDSLAGDYYLGQEVSRDAHSNLSALSDASAIYPVLKKGDIIVDKMHIHYGKKNQNPVANMRFYAKGAGPEEVARHVPEDVYQTVLPRTFEELAVRVFCRDPSKEGIAMKAFRRFCSTCNTHLPFPSQSQSEGLGQEEEEEEGDVVDEEIGASSALQVEVRQFAHLAGGTGSSGSNGW